MNTTSPLSYIMFLHIQITQHHVKIGFLCISLRSHHIKKKCFKHKLKTYKMTA
jgi:hypothetical protein